MNINISKLNNSSFVSTKMKFFTLFQFLTRLLTSSPRPKKALQVRSNVKVMLTAFFDSRGVVNHEYAPQGQTSNKEYYRDVLRRPRDAVRLKRQDLWTSGNWRLHHDNAPTHSSQLIQTFLANKQTPVLRQAPYSPDMAPATSGCSTLSRGH